MTQAVFIIGLFVACIDRTGGMPGGDAAVPEPAFYRELSETAARMGIDLYVFSPEQFRGGELFGYRWRRSRWVLDKVPFPDIVYDRCYYTSAGQRKACKLTLAAIRARKPHRLLSGGNLPSKWEVYKLLAADAPVAGLLPPTAKVRSADQLLAALAKYREGLFLKPAAGMQGKGTLLVRRDKESNGIAVDGRTRANKPFSLLFNGEAEWKQWISAFIGETPYIVQPYLKLAMPDGRSFDIRVLLQKDGSGRFAVTGQAARVGKAGSITSNLHGGGSASDAAKLLNEAFGRKIGGEISAQMNDISEYIAHRLENRYGRFAELGFDYGIADGGKLWLLEVNSKPGRSAFGQLNDGTAAALSIERPLLYARLLNSRQAPSYMLRRSANGRRLYSTPYMSLKTRRPSAR